MSIRRQMTVLAATTRSPAVIGGKRGAPATFESMFYCTPLDPASPEIVELSNLKTPMELLQTFVLGPYDIREGDNLVVGDKTYPIRACGEWECRDGKLVFLLLEDLKAQ